MERNIELDLQNLTDEQLGRLGSHRTENDLKDDLDRVCDRATALVQVRSHGPTSFLEEPEHWLLNIDCKTLSQVNLIIGT